MMFGTASTMIAGFFFAAATLGIHSGVVLPISLATVAAGFGYIGLSVLTNRVVGRVYDSFQSLGGGVVDIDGRKVMFDGETVHQNSRDVVRFDDDGLALLLGPDGLAVRGNKAQLMQLQQELLRRVSSGTQSDIPEALSRLVQRP